MKEKLFVIAGTGFSIDGTLVNIVTEWADGFVSVCPFKYEHSISEALKIDKRYLQDVSDSTFYNYKFFVVMENEKGEVINELSFDINNSPRNVTLDTIRGFIVTNLSPILKME